MLLTVTFQVHKYLINCDEDKTVLLISSRT